MRNCTLFKVCVKRDRLVMWGNYVAKTAFDTIYLCTNRYNVRVDQNGGLLQTTETTL